MTDRKQMNGAAAHVGASSAELLAEWHAAMADRVAEWHAAMADDRTGAAAREREKRIEERAWRMPVSDPVALLLRAQIVRDEVWPDLDGGGSSRFEAVLAGKATKDDIEVGAFGERAVAELVKAVLWSRGEATLAPAPANAGWSRRQLQETIERIWTGLTAMQTLIESRQDEHGGVDEECVTSLGFVLGSLSDLLEDVTKAIDGDEVRPTLPAA